MRDAPETTLDAANRYHAIMRAYRAALADRPQLGDDFRDYDEAIYDWLDTIEDILKGEATLDDLIVGYPWMEELR